MASCVVVMGKEQYLSEGLKHLDDQSVYEKLPKGEYTKALGIELNRTYKSWLEDKLITYKLYRRLGWNPDNLRCQRVYFLYKAHKTPPSVHPIVSGFKGPTETASWVLNKALKTILPNLPQLFLDTFEAINQLENLHAPKQCLLVTIDIKSVYTNIPQREGTGSVLNIITTHLYPATCQNG